MSYKETKYSDGSFRRVWRDENGELHREDGPAFIQYYTFGPVETEQFFRFDEPHRISGPALIEYYPDGSIEYEAFYLNGEYHRTDGPSEISYHEDGEVHSEWFHIKGEYLGMDEEGFWALWERLNDNQKKDTNLLKLLTKYS